MYRRPIAIVLVTIAAIVAIAAAVPTPAATLRVTQATPCAATPAASPGASPAASANVAGSPEATVLPACHGPAVSVVISNLAYDPAQLVIPVGTTVTWTNRDPVPHTVTQTGGGFTSGQLDPGASFSLTFDTPGTYDYFCAYHGTMKATIIVR